MRTLVDPNACMVALILLWSAAQGALGDRGNGILQIPWNVIHGEHLSLLMTVHYNMCPLMLNHVL